MKDVLFTSTDWVVSEPYSDGNAVDIISGSYFIATVHNGANEEDCAKHNAALIGCAPEMYHLLETCRDVLISCGKIGLPDHIAQVLYKARGER